MPIIYILKMNKFEFSRRAAAFLACRTDDWRSNIIISLADAIDAAAARILEANASDVSRMEAGNPMADRLRLDSARLSAITADMRTVSRLPSPLGRTLWTTERPNGITIRKVTVPFGVIGVIYEARPNVTIDVAALCLKAGSACVLKGGSDAAATNKAIVDVIRQALVDAGCPADAVTLLEGGHEASAEMLGAVGEIDVIIPRGSRRLIDFVRENSCVPVIETGAGVCHTYMHSSGSVEICRDIALNAKTRRVSVCNALDTLVIDHSRLADLPTIVAPMADHGVAVYADADSYAALDGHYKLLRHAEASDFGREWLDYKMSVKTVEGIDDAIEFINAHGSRHSEAIVAEDTEAVSRFQQQIDAACVYANVSTAFTDGGQFGFGAEIGISTQKLHARGPMGLPEICTYKYLIDGHGQTRP